MNLGRVLAVTLSAILVVGGAVVAKANALDEERGALIAQAAELDSKLTVALARGGYLEHTIATAQEQAEDYTALLDVRPGFIGELKSLATALQNAEGKIDTASLTAAAHAAQESVLAERADPAVITNATATVHALVTKANDDVAAWEAAQVQLAGAPESHWSSSGPDGYARVRGALDRVGGAGVGLYESSSCAGGSAPACANSNGYIKYRADVAGWDEGRLNWAMAHELAHIYQFRVWGSMTASAAYQSMFGSDPEFLANCMALVLGYAGSVSCNGDQQVWASGIWVGAVR